MQPQLSPSEIFIFLSLCKNSPDRQNVSMVFFLYPIKLFHTQESGTHRKH